MNKKNNNLSSLRGIVDAEAISYPINRLPRKHKCSLAMTEKICHAEFISASPTGRRPRNKFGVTAAILILAFIFSVNANAQTNVANETELKAAITNNAVINLKADITLTGGEISISGTIVTINGGGHFISGANASRIFSLTSSTSKLTINNLTLTKGYFSGNGGAVFNNGTFTATNCSFYDNTGFSGSGGAVCNANSGTFTATNCSFYNNEASSGGAVGNSGNTASSTATNCSFEKNTATANGGAVLNNGTNASFTAENCSFENNTAGYGGAVANTLGSNFISTNCSFENNTASTYGGAVYNSDGEFTAINCSFIENTANGSGGAVSNNKIFMSTNCSFYNNKANGAFGTGGAVRNDGSAVEFTAENCSFENNKVTATGATGGGAVYNFGNPGITFVVTNCSFKNNMSYYGGALYNVACNSFTVKNCSFESNTATNNTYGGAVYNGDGNFSFENCSFYDNTAYRGGAIYTYTNNTNLYHNTLIKNNATDDGGGIYINSGNVYAYNCIIAGNTATGTYPQINGTISGVGNNLIDNGSTVTYASIFGSNLFSYGYIRPDNISANQTPALATPTITTDQIGQTRSTTGDVTYGAVESAISKVVVKIEIGNNGKVSIAGTTYSFATTQSFAVGSNVTLTLVPDDGYEIGRVSGSGSLSGNTYTIPNISANQTIKVTFGKPLAPGTILKIGGKVYLGPNSKLIIGPEK